MINNDYKGMLLTAHCHPYTLGNWLRSNVLSNRGWREERSGVKKYQHLPLDVVFPVENLLQKCDEPKRANKYETKRSAAEQVFTRRWVGVSHFSAQHPGLTVTPASVSLFAAFRTRMAGVSYPLEWTLSITLFSLLVCFTALWPQHHRRKVMCTGICAWDLKSLVTLF